MGVLKGAWAAGIRRTGGGPGVPARSGSGLASAGGAGAACGRGSGPGGAGAETGFAGPSGAERPGRAEPAGAADPGAEARNQAEIHSAGWGEGMGEARPRVCGTRGALRDSVVTGLRLQVEQIVEAWKCHALRRGNAARGAPCRRRRGTLPREHHRFLDLPFK